MIEDIIKTTLKDIHKNNHNRLEFINLLDYMEFLGIPFYNRRLVGAIGLATFDGIYLDIKKFNTYPNSVLFFVILHEIAHYKRFIRFGKAYMVKMISIDDFDIFFDYVVNEEMTADRYASFIYYKMNKEKYPKQYTQQLDDSYKKEQYKPIAKLLFGVVDNNEENYKKLLEGFII